MPGHPSTLWYELVLDIEFCLVHFHLHLFPCSRQPQREEKDLLLRMPLYNRIFMP